jgi:hydrogenase-1 operon protein HyaE
MSQNFSGLLDKLVATRQISDLDTESFQAFMDAPGNSVVLLVTEPDKVPESWDLAVIFPDLLAAAGATLRAGVLRPARTAALQGRFAVNRLPALLFLRDGGFVGVVEGLRDWSEYVVECRAMLEMPVSRIPGIGIAVAAASSGCH